MNGVCLRGGQALVSTGVGRVLTRQETGGGRGTEAAAEGNVSPVSSALSQELRSLRR